MFIWRQLHLLTVAVLFSVCMLSTDLLWDEMMFCILGDGLLGVVAGRSYKLVVVSTLFEGFLVGGNG